MTSKDDIARGFPPKLNIAALPAEEQKSAAQINELLYSYMTLVASYRSDLELFQFATANPKMGDWGRIALRDAVMNVYHLNDVFEAVQELTESSPALRSLIDKDIRKKSSKLFQNTFPEFKDIRNAVGHAGKKEINVEQHIIKGPAVLPTNLNFNVGAGAEVSFSNCIFDGNKIAFNWKGKLATQELSPQTLKNLEEAKFLFYSAFLKASI